MHTYVPFKLILTTNGIIAEYKKLNLMFTSES